jgi:hypothetical protein
LSQSGFGPLRSVQKGQRSRIGSANAIYRQVSCEKALTPLFLYA